MKKKFLLVILLSVGVLKITGCSTSSCSSAPSWLKNTYYWVDDKYAFSKGSGNIRNLANSVNFGNDYGYRPVIEVPTSDLA